MLYLILDGIAVYSALSLLKSWRDRRRNPSLNLPYPPGPKQLPILGNILDMPPSDEWEAGRRWGEEYGDLVFVQNFGTPYLFVNSFDAAFDLFEKRGGNYSSRPLKMMLELEEWTWMTVMMPYGDEHKKSRQFIHQFFQPLAAAEYQERQTRATHKLLKLILDDPKEYANHIRTITAELILMITYGYQTLEKQDPYVKLVERGMDSITDAQRFYLVDHLPILRYIPAWFPGAQFQKTILKGIQLSHDMLYEPFRIVKQQMLDGTGVPSIARKLLEKHVESGGKGSSEELIAKTAGIIYAAGGDTTVSVLLTFILAMVLYPEAMRKGQRELDEIIGKDSLPEIKDKARLPYIRAIYQEVLRWQPVTPLAVAHAATEDDVYRGYRIPEGTTILPNAWAMFRNPKEYPEPDKFIPERWLVDKPPTEANKAAFGFGRRICPGRHFAENSLFIGIASILACFDIGKALDEHGQPITPKEEYTPNFVRHPRPFKCAITPRSLSIGQIIRQTVEAEK